MHKIDILLRKKLDKNYPTRRGQSRKKKKQKQDKSRKYESNSQHKKVRHGNT